MADQLARFDWADKKARFDLLYDTLCEFPPELIHIILSYDAYKLDGKVVGLFRGLFHTAQALEEKRDRMHS